MRKLIVLLSTVIMSYLVQGQNKRQKTPCDSLLGKSYAFVYEQAAAILEGQMLASTKYKEGNEFEVLSRQNFKDNVRRFKFFQKETSNWFSFEKDSNYVFLVFPNYEDPVFSPCILFGKKEKMEGLISYAQSQCEIELFPKTGRCSGSSDPVCGCNGITYGNPCLAEKAGVKTYSFGECGK